MLGIDEELDADESTHDSAVRETFDTVIDTTPSADIRTLVNGSDLRMLGTMLPTLSKDDIDGLHDAIKDMPPTAENIVCNYSIIHYLVIITNMHINSIN